MKVLITQVWLDTRGGSEAVVRDIAVGLLRRGHRPIVYSPKVGTVGAEIRKRGIPVVDDLRSIAEPPDIIHGQHHIETAQAIIQFPEVPAINMCHAWEFWVERPVKFPQVRKYVTISEAVRDRLVHEEGIPPEQVVILPNAVDLCRIPVRKVALSPRPLRAACFATAKAHIPVLRSVCEQNGIAFDAIGKCGDMPSASIEEELSNYDVVFATGRSALEAACCGCAVVVCDDRGVAGMLRTSNLNAFRQLNFALRLLVYPLTHDRLQAALELYDAEDATAVSKKLREVANSDVYLDRLMEIYESAMAEDRSSFNGEIFRSSLLSFLHSALPRTSSDLRWPWLSEREFYINEISRLDGELAVFREREEKRRDKPLRRAFREFRNAKHRLIGATWGRLTGWSRHHSSGT